MSLDECTPEDKRIQDNMRNSGNTSATINEFNEKCTFKSSKDLKIIKSNACSSTVSKEHTKLENDNLSKNNCTHTSNVQNAKLITHNDENLKEASDSKKIISTNTCELNKSDNVDSNISSTDFANVKTCKSEKLPTTATVSNSNDDNLGNKMVDKCIKNSNHSLKLSPVEFNNDSNYVDLVKLDTSKDSSFHKDTIAHKSKNKNPELMDVTESKSASNISKFTEKVTNTLLIQNQNNSCNVKDNAEVTNEDRGGNKSVTQIVDNNLILQNILLVSSNVDTNNENETKNVDTVVPRRKRIKQTINTIQDRAEEDKQGRKYLTSKVKCGISSISSKRLKEKENIKKIL